MDEKFLLFLVVLSSTTFLLLRFAFLSPNQCHSVNNEEENHYESDENAHFYHTDLFPSTDQFNSSKFKLHIKVLAFDRPASISRCLHSLQKAFYDGDTVSLDIFIDHTFNNNRSTWNRKARERASISHTVLKLADELEWKYGEKRIHFQSHNEGIQPQWIEAWWPESLNDFAFIVEDDMEVSPLFYRYFKKMVLTYYYNQSNFDPSIYGISFQRQVFVPGIGGKQLIYGKRVPFLYLLVGTWGQFLFPNPWKQFRLWYDLHRYNESHQPVLNGLKTNRWFLSKGNKLWTPWIIKWAYSANMYNMYLSMHGNKSLTVSHRDVGSNFRNNRGPDASILTQSDVDSDDRDNMVDWIATSALTRLDYCCKIVTPGRIAHTFDEMDAMLKANVKGNVVSLIMVPPGAYDVIRNWLCHVDGLDHLQFVLVIPEADVASDLSSRGHMVFHLTQMDGMAIQGLPSGTIAWSLPHVQLVYVVLSLGYDVIVSNPYAIWHENPSSDLVGARFDLIGFLKFDSICESVIGLKSTDKVVLVWSEILEQWNDTIVMDKADVDEELMLTHSQQFMRILLKSGLSVRYPLFTPLKTVSEVALTLKSDSDSEYVPMTLTASGKSKAEKVNGLKSTGLWVIDDFDFACKSVTCRKVSIFHH